MIPAGVITFIKSPLGKGVLVALGILLYVQLQRNEAADGAAAECRADVYQAMVADLQQKLKNAQTIATENQLQADRTEAILAVREKELEETKRLVGEAGGRIPADIRKRLLGNHGK